MKENVLVRKARVADAGNLAVLLQQVWISTYAEEGIRTEFSDYVLDEFTPTAVRARLLEEGKMSLVVEADGHIMAYVEVNLRAKCPHKYVDAPELAVLYVLERFKRRGLGRRLLREVEQLLLEQGYGALWTSVYYWNTNAIEFYHRKGFHKVGITYFEMDGNRYENWIMLKGRLSM
jgi:diamine N-acetyltransferase